MSHNNDKPVIVIRIEFIGIVRIFHVQFAPTISTLAIICPTASDILGTVTQKYSSFWVWIGPVILHCWNFTCTPCKVQWHSMRMSFKNTIFISWIENKMLISIITTSTKIMHDITINNRTSILNKSIILNRQCKSFIRDEQITRFKLLGGSVIPFLQIRRLGNSPILECRRLSLCPYHVRR